MSRRLFMALSLACVLVLTAFTPYAPPEPPSTVTDRAWVATAFNAAVDVIVTAPGFPNLSPARTLPSKEAKTKFVVDALLAHAATSQAQLRTDLAARGKQVVPLWITNQLVVLGATRADVQWLAARADVSRVDVDVQSSGLQRSDRQRAMNDRPQSSIVNSRDANSPGSFGPIRASESGSKDASRSAKRDQGHQSSIEWGVNRVNAPQVWAMGYTGQGIVVANLDTGVRWDHAALKPKYRGWNGATADHNYNWFDAAPDANQSASSAPVDVNGHGTHTVGTSNGDDGAGNQIGVAPGAQWIACRNMAGPGGIGSVARYTACFQFALAPTDVAGNAPDPSKGADITSNSWGCDPAFGEIGCDVPTALVTVTQVLRDAGVMVVSSAGNSGSACRSVVNAPATLDQSFSIGATDSGNSIASFSSRGPSSLTGKIKPDVVAPGVGVRSATFDSTTSYGFKSGTSMAAPHVAGVAALVWSAAPWLRGDVPATEALLRETAQPFTSPTTCFGTPGSAVPNNTFGYGLIDARAAVERVLGAPVSTSPASVQVNTPVTFTIAITNPTASPRTGVVITSAIPASATLITSDPPGTVNGNAIQWMLPPLAPSTTVTVSVVVSTSVLTTLSNAPVQLSFDGALRPITGKAATTVVTVTGRQVFVPWLAR